VGEWINLGAVALTTPHPSTLLTPIHPLDTIALLVNQLTIRPVDAAEDPALGIAILRRQTAAHEGARRRTT